MGLGLRWYDWFGINLSSTISTGKQVVVGGAKIAGQTVYTLADKVTVGSLSRTEASVEAFVGTSGTYSERAEAARKAGDKAALNSMTLGYSGARDKWQHTKDIVGGMFAAQRYKLGINQLVEGWNEGDWEKFARGGAETLGGASQTTLAVAGAAAAGETAGLYELPRYRLFGGAFGGGDALGSAIAEGPEGAVAFAPASEAPTIKAGSSDGLTAGQRFPARVRQEAFAENPTKTCVFCGREGTGTQVDHAVARSRGGNATIDNAQLACPHCNPSKGAGEFPKNPPPVYEGPWPPPHWPGQE